MGSSCSRTPVGHWAGVGALAVALLLSVGGVASPYWRVVDTSDGTHYPVHEGLWQECYRQGSRTACHFNPERTDWWRAIQGIELASLLFLFFGVVSSLCSINVRGKSAAVCALCGGLTGLLGDMLYVGFTETRHTTPYPGELAYAWSFALSTAGSIFALLASAALFSAVCCVPKFASRPVKPYGPYRHYSVDVDKHGHPRYQLHHYVGTLYQPDVDRSFKGGVGVAVGAAGCGVGSQPSSHHPPPISLAPSLESSYHRYPQPCPYPDPFQGGAVRELSTAAKRRREFYDKTRREGRVKFAVSDGALMTDVYGVPPPTLRLLDPRDDAAGTASDKLLPTGVPPSPYPDYPRRESGEKASETEPRHKRVRQDNLDDVPLNTSNTSGGSVPVKPPLDTSNDASRSSKASPVPPPDGKSVGDTREVIRTLDRRPSYTIASDDSGHASPTHSEERQKQQQRHPGHWVWAVGGARHDVSVNRFQRLPAVPEDHDRGPFTIEKAMKESNQARPDRVDQHEPDPSRPEHLVFRRTEPPSLPPSVYLPPPSYHSAPRHWDHPRRPWRPWGWWRPWPTSQDRVVVKTRKGKQSLGAL